MQKINVNMLGGFNIDMDGNQIGLGSNPKANFLKLIQMVLLNKDHGVNKQELITGVFGYKDLLDENNSLNNLFHQARTQLQKGGLPGKKYIVGKKGVYRPEESDNYEVVIDVFTFKDLVRKANKEPSEHAKATYYKQALALYKGELLPENATDNWVIAESTNLKRQFDEIILFLDGYYRKEKKYDDLYEMYNYAVKIYPDNGLQIKLIEALILKKDYSAAYELYTKTAKYYLEELEIPLPESLLACYEHIYEDAKMVSSDIEDIQASILQKDEALKRSLAGQQRMGAYFCPFPSFIDVYNVLRRNLMRRGSSIFMMMCTLVDKEGKPIANPEKQAEKANDFQVALTNTLRQGDVFTKYSSSQFLLLLIGTKKEDCSIVYQRISHSFKEVSGNSSDFQYKIISLAEIPQILQNPEK